MSSRKTLDTICADECPPEKYCILKEIILSSQCDRTLLQLKVVEIHKYLISKRDNKEYNWQDATMDYVNTKKAEKFATVYSPEISPIEIYKQIEQLEKQV